MHLVKNTIAAKLVGRGRDMKHLMISSKKGVAVCFRPQFHHKNGKAD